VSSAYATAKRTLNELLDASPELLDTTFDQLRTLLVVHETGSALRAARALGREQSSVQKQLDTLNRNCQALCGEMLTLRQGRGKDFLFTPTGEAAVELAHLTMSQWLGAITWGRRRLGRMLSVGTTEFTLPIISRSWERVQAEFEQEEVEFKVTHVRTKDLWQRLETRQVDLICGSVLSTPETDERLDGYEIVEFIRGQPVILTNLPEERLPSGEVAASRLDELPLVVPPAGLVADLLNCWYGPVFRDRLDVVADIDDIHYGLSLLRSGFVRGCMIVTGSIGERVAAQGGPDDMPLRALPLEGDLDPRAEIMTGAFVRRDDLERYADGHPLNRLWVAVQQDAKTFAAKRPAPDYLPR